MKKMASRSAPAEPFFLQADCGRRFCLYHAPRAEKECRGAFIYVHPFGEEMNKSRRMAALQARAFAAMGFGVLQIDLFGCGDSSGDFSDARWDIWKRGSAIASTWLMNVSRHLSACGDCALAHCSRSISPENLHKKLDRLFYGSPSSAVNRFLTQFLRLRLANEMLSAVTE